MANRWQEYVSWLPTHLREEPVIQNTLLAVGGEIDRLDEAEADLFNQMFVQTATWGLKYREAALQLPVEPAGQTYEQRRTVILTSLAARNAASGAAFNAALQNVSTAYKITVDYTSMTIHVTITYNPSAYTAAQLEKIIRELVPAHFNFTVDYEAFIAGVSKAGDRL